LVTILLPAIDFGSSFENAPSTICLKPFSNHLKNYPVGDAMGHRLAQPLMRVKQLPGGGRIFPETQRDRFSSPP
jgi:hypothetical protein